VQKWIITGISGSGRIELMNELAEHCRNQLHKVVTVHDAGAIIREECLKHRIRVADERILDVDGPLLRTLRAAALKEVNIRILSQPDADLHLIGLHAMFRWKRRLVPGISYPDVLALSPDGFISVIDDVRTVFETNQRNPKWDEDTLPNPEETQEWMMEEEFLTEVLADVVGKPIYLVARKRNIGNLADLFFTKKKKVYLSFPITAVRETEPQLLERIQGPILSELQNLFVVFNPLAIKDMALTYPNPAGVPELVSQLTPRAKEILKSRTVERDFQFIDQSDAVVVFYETEKVSPGVLAEIFYAHRNTKPVFASFAGKPSPFLESAVTELHSTPEALLESLRRFAAE
jgi:adenylate kinase/nucleoside 2-deoxyribosyltransferase